MIYRAGRHFDCKPLPPEQRATLNTPKALAQITAGFFEAIPLAIGLIAYFGLFKKLSPAANKAILGTSIGITAACGILEIFLFCRKIQKEEKDFGKIVNVKKMQVKMFKEHFIVQSDGGHLNVGPKGNVLITRNHMDYFLATLDGDTLKVASQSLPEGWQLRKTTSNDYSATVHATRPIKTNVRKMGNATISDTKHVPCLISYSFTPGENLYTHLLEEKKK